MPDSLTISSRGHVLYGAYSDLRVRSRRRLTTSSSLIIRKLHEDAARTHSQACEVAASRVCQRAAILRAIAFFGRAGTSGVSEVKKKGGAHHSSCPVLFPIFLTALLATCSLTRGKVSVGMFRDRSDPLTDYLRKAVPLSARKDTRFTSSSKGRCK